MPAMTGMWCSAGGNTDKMAHLARFSTILAAEGHLYIAGSDQLYAFSFTP